MSLERVNALIARALSSNFEEEARSCAMIALREMRKHGYVVAPGAPSPRPADPRTEDFASFWREVMRHGAGPTDVYRGTTNEWRERDALDGGRCWVCGNAYLVGERIASHSWDRFSYVHARCVR